MGAKKMNKPNNLSNIPSQEIPINPCFSIPVYPTSQYHHNKKNKKRDRSGKLIIGEGLFVKGQLESCKSLFIKGRLEASVKCEVLKVSDNGVLIGSAITCEADVYGLFKGELTVAGRLTVHGNGAILGQVRYGELKVEPGGTLSGDLTPSNEEKKSPASLFQRACLP
jgi:cytoskeletal protein CcmA (bactofilin family)